MNGILDKICKTVIDEVSPSKVILYGEKKNGEQLREASLLIVVKSDPKEAERRLYRILDCDVAFNLLVYREEDFILLEKDETSYAYSIMSKGRVLYG
ncbi:MAG: hypothetical protein E7648_00785 [Ruminococcaceae bacterium]|nr:hypothetical protein [Oscillospiraceae bacterium]